MPPRDPKGAMLSLPPPLRGFGSLSLSPLGGVYFAHVAASRALCYLACVFGGRNVWCTRTHALSVAVFGRSVGWSWCLPFLPCLTLSCFLVSVGIPATLVSVCFSCSFLFMSYLLFDWSLSQSYLSFVILMLYLCYDSIPTYVMLVLLLF